MIHIQNGTGTTVCGNTFDNLAKSDPLGSTVSLVVSGAYGTDQQAAKRALDEIANRANCPRCLYIYNNSTR